MVFKNKYFFLSTFHVRQFSLAVDGKICDFITVEAAFQAQKVPEIADRFSQIRGMEAKAIGEKLKILVDDWDTYQLYAMANALHAKFHYPDLFNDLKAIEKTIVMDNYWGDSFWGKYRGQGHNFLGRMYMNMQKNNNNLEALYKLIEEEFIPELKNIVQ